MQIQELVSLIVQRTYEIFDQLGLSVTTLLVIAGVFLFALFFATREALAWFLKVDDVKKDLKRVRDSLNEIEGELRALQTILTRQSESTQAGSTIAPEAAEEVLTPAVQPAPTKAPIFPVTH